MMKMKNLIPLHHNMIKAQVTLAHFCVTIKGVTFDMLFSTAEQPYFLVIGALKHNFFLELPVHQGYLITGIPDDSFFQLCKILNLKPGKNQFHSHMFLTMVDDKIPATVGKAPEPCDLQKLLPPARREQGDEADKIYFAGWCTHVSDGRKARNLEKTLRMTQSRPIYNFCKENNISSKWTSNIDDTVPFVAPEQYDIYASKKKTIKPAEQRSPDLFIARRLVNIYIFLRNYLDNLEKV